MKHIVRQLLTTFSFLGGWVLLLLVLYLVGVPLPHTTGFAAVDRLIGGAQPAEAAPQQVKTSPAWDLPAKLKTGLPPPAPTAG